MRQDNRCQKYRLREEEMETQKHTQLIWCHVQWAQRWGSTNTQALDLHSGLGSGLLEEGAQASENTHGGSDYSSATYSDVCVCVCVCVCGLEQMSSSFIRSVSWQIKYAHCP